ncbi:uncharacterized protein [Panulirus ornatus]|uniref:uncharacterized protein n=1 Tax=Panulirus ornatus TaxID=150431 RepID=UPI003A86C95C
MTCLTPMRVTLLQLAPSRMRNLMLGVAIAVAVLFLTVSLSQIFLPPIAVKEDIRHDLQQKVASLQKQQYETRLLLNRLYCATKTVLPSGGFCINENKIIVGGNDMWSATLLVREAPTNQAARLSDLQLTEPHGEALCLTQHYGCFLPPAGLTMKQQQTLLSDDRWDGASNIDELSGGKIQVVDLSVPVDLGRRFDWVMSLEVGEHIPPAGEEAFLDDVVGHACKGVVLSWAVPGQNGHHHVNCRSNDYIKAKMALRGLKPQAEEERKLRDKVEISHFKNTIMVFTFLEERC